MTEWRLRVYWQGGDEAHPARATFAEVRADLERVAPDEDWTYIERRIDGGEWQRVAFAGYSVELPDAWTYDPEAPATQSASHRAAGATTG